MDYGGVSSSSAVFVEIEIFSSINMPFTRCNSPPFHSLILVLTGNTYTFTIHIAQFVLSVCIALLRCKAVKSHSLGIVLSNTLTIRKHDAQVVLSVCMRITRPIASTLQRRVHAPVLLQGGTIEQPPYRPSQHLDHSQN